MSDIDPLWENPGGFEEATEEQIIFALFHAPKFPPPEKMGFLRRNRQGAIAKYQQLFYEGRVPRSVQEVRDRIFRNRKGEDHAY